jgi:putative membrane protein
MKLIINILIDTLAILVGAYLLSGVQVDTLVTAGLAAVVIGVLDMFLKPILKILAFPITFITLGLFMLVVNAVIIWLANLIVPGFSVDTFITAIIFSIVISLVNTFLHALSK